MSTTRTKRTRLEPTAPDAQDRREYWHLYYLANKERKRRYDAAHYRKRCAQKYAEAAHTAPARAPRPARTERTRQARPTTALQRRLVNSL